MNGTEFIINFENKRAYLTGKIFLPLDQLDLPDNFKQSTSVASWRVRVLDYNSNDNRIFAEILSYHTSRQPFSADQSAYEYEFAQLQKIDFRSIDTLQLPHSLKAPVDKTAFTASNATTSIGRYQLIPKTIKESVSLPLDNIHFRSGYVSFEKRIGNLTYSVEFRVYNSYIREEFEPVKNYFGNILKTKKFKFDITASIRNQEIEENEVYSAEVDRIDDSFVESLKLEFVKTITSRKIEDDHQKTLLTIDDLFDVLTENKIKATVLFEDEKSFFENMLQISNTKHYKHLQFLADKHAFKIMKLRFIIKPFSFIFLIKGEEKFYIVWETLNTSEATYIWQAEKDRNAVKTELEKVSDIIKVIKMSGKTDYLSKAEDNFIRISHDYSDSLARIYKMEK
ncbi:hypothetical protein ACQ9BO_15560 [Flavobacterium sp. P21]|uniref:hypothetical protein n=1 Tax=Flavobacterium sp. P21 TaxID=3423948 RepID=UPI003D66745E